MSTTKVGAEFKSILTRVTIGDVVLEKDGKSLQVECIPLGLGVLYLRRYRNLNNYNITPKQAISIIADCFEKNSEFQDVLKEKGVFGNFQELQGIIISINNIPVLVTRYNHDADVLYNEWKCQLDMEEAEWRETLTK